MNEGGIKKNNPRINFIKWMKIHIYQFLLVYFEPNSNKNKANEFINIHPKHHNTH